MNKYYSPYGVSRCWSCGRKLTTKKGGGYNFAVVQDPIGNKMRVHKSCVTAVLGEQHGFKEVKDA